MKNLRKTPEPENVFVIVSLSVPEPSSCLVELSLKTEAPM